MRPFCFSWALNFFKKNTDNYFGYFDNLDNSVNKPVDIVDNYSLLLMAS